MKTLPRYIPENSTPLERAGLPAIVYTYTDNKGRPSAIAYIGKQGKKTWHYCFRNEEQRNVEIDKFFDGIAEREDFKLSRKVEKTCFKHGYQVGDILYSSWGYDQTNTEFYQVIAKTEKTVTLRHIGANHVAGNDGFMCGSITADKDNFKGEPFTRTVSPCGRMGDEHKAKGSVSYSEYPGGYSKSLWWWDGQPCHISWYA